MLHSHQHRFTQRLAYVVGRWVLITFLLLSTVPAHAEWIAVERDYLSPSLQTVYIDPDSIRRKGNVVTMWQLIGFKWMQGNPRGPTSRMLKSLPAGFSRRSEAQRTTRVRLASSLAAALPDSLFEHPAVIRHYQPTHYQ